MLLFGIRINFFNNCSFGLNSEAFLLYYLCGEVNKDSPKSINKPYNKN